MKNTIISPSTRERSINVTWPEAFEKLMNREFEVDSGSKASNIGRSGSYLLVRVPRHGAGQSDPCQNDVEKRHGENADAISPFHVLCAFLVFLRLPRWWNYRKWAWSRWNSNTFVRFRCHVAEKLWIKDWFSSRGWRSPFVQTSPHSPAPWRGSRASTWFWSTNCQTERRPLLFQQFTSVYRGFV